MGSNFIFVEFCHLLLYYIHYEVFRFNFLPQLSHLHAIERLHHFVLPVGQNIPYFKGR